MAWNIIQRVFLLGLLVQTGLARVLTPTNMTLQCHNNRNILRWNYGQLTPGLKFKVRVASEISDAVEVLVKSPTLHADLSSFSDPDDSYYVSVSAVMGDNVSDSTVGISYSYFQDAIVEQLCTWDFPAVNVTVLEHNVVHFRFMHPSLLYNTDLKLKKTRIHELPPFDYDVKVINQSKHPHRFQCIKKVCEGKAIPVNNSQDKYCVHVEGTMTKISVQPTQQYCSSSAEQPSINESSLILIAIGVLSFILLVAISALIFMKKIRPLTSLPVPNILNFNGPKKQQLVPEIDPDETCVVHVDPVPSTHLLSTPDINDSTLVDAPSIESEGRMPIRVQTEDSDQAEANQEDVKDAGYKKGNDLDEDSSQNLDFSCDAGYEKRSTLE